MIVKRKRAFAAAHKLDMVFPEGHKCANLHGHTFIVKVVITVEDELVDAMVIDFGEIDKIIDRYDHTYLNDLPEFDERAPTSENLAAVIAGQVYAAVENATREAPFVEVEVQESENSSALFTSEE